MTLKRLCLNIWFMFVTFAAEIGYFLMGFETVVVLISLCHLTKCIRSNLTKPFN